MLGASRSGLGPRERLIEGKAVGLAQGHLAVTADIGGTAQPADQVVREERRANLIRLLSRLALRTARQKGVPADRAGRIDKKWGSPLAAFETGHVAARAGIQDTNADIRREAIDPAAHLLVGDQVLAQA